MSKTECPSPSYYCLNFATLPDILYDSEVPVKEWHAKCETAGSKGFPAGSLARVEPCEKHVEAERIIGIPLYMLCNLLPLVLPLFGLLLFLGFLIAKLFFAYLALLISIELLYNLIYPQKSLKKTTKGMQYVYTERNTQKYTSMRWVWPKSLSSPQDKPVIFCVAPHGVAPLGVTAYPGFSKLFGDRLNHPTAAPVVLKLPLIGWGLKKMGYVPAKAKSMEEVLTKKEENVSVILDGIAGMFQQDASVEKLYLSARKPICKIALRTGCCIVPVYGFGHTSLWQVVVDPFGILEKLSIALNVSICPFIGRFFWPIGPPRRIPLTLAFGDPIRCDRIENPTQEQIDAYHAQMIEGFKNTFETHKGAYGWSKKQLKVV